MENNREYLIKNYYGGDEKEFESDLKYGVDKTIHWSDIEVQSTCNPQQYHKALHFIKFSVGYLPETQICMPHLGFVQSLVENVLKDHHEGMFCR